jgi:hypothetical protein
MHVRTSRFHCAFALGAVVAGAAACTASSSAGTEFVDSPGPVGSTSNGTSSAAAEGAFAEDAAPALGVAAVVIGSPLCNAMAESDCYPDLQSGQCELLNDAALIASSASADAAASAADASALLDASLDARVGADAAGAFGCHVAQTSATAVTPICVTAGPGGDGSACATVSDCAPGFECVGAGTCRRYCCGGTCDDTHFCDVQSEVASGVDEAGVVVPVCMPVTPCALPGESADAGGCGVQGRGCAVVLVGTATDLAPAASCVDTGAAGVGESCDVEHCADGLTCIGSWGNGICYMLCDAAVPTCPAGQVCSGGLPLFPDPLTGVCKEPVGADY